MNQTSHASPRQVSRFFLMKERSIPMPHLPPFSPRRAARNAARALHIISKSGDSQPDKHVQEKHQQQQEEKLNLPSYQSLRYTPIVQPMLRQVSMSQSPVKPRRCSKHRSSPSRSASFSSADQTAPTSKSKRVLKRSASHTTRPGIGSSLLDNPIPENSPLKSSLETPSPAIGELICVSSFRRNPKRDSVAFDSKGRRGLVRSASFSQRRERRDSIAPIAKGRRPLYRSASFSDNASSLRKRRDSLALCSQVGCADPSSTSLSNNPTIKSTYSQSIHGQKQFCPAALNAEAPSSPQREATNLSSLSSSAHLSPSRSGSSTIHSKHPAPSSPKRSNPTPSRPTRSSSSGKRPSKAPSPTSPKRCNRTDTRSNNSSPSRPTRSAHAGSSNPVFSSPKHTPHLAKASPKTPKASKPAEQERLLSLGGSFLAGPRQLNAPKEKQISVSEHCRSPSRCDAPPTRLTSSLAREHGQRPPNRQCLSRSVSCNLGSPNRTALAKATANYISSPRKVFTNLSDVVAEYDDLFTDSLHSSSTRDTTEILSLMESFQTTDNENLLGDDSDDEEEEFW